MLSLNIIKNRESVENKSYLATYEEIKQYVMDKFGVKVSTLCIAQVKREFGLIERINYNSGSGKNPSPQVTDKKRDMIIDALKHFQMIE